MSEAENKKIAKKEKIKISGKMNIVAQKGKMLPLRIDGELVVVKDKPVPIDCDSIDHATKKIIRQAIMANDIKEIK